LPLRVVEPALRVLARPVLDLRPRAEVDFLAVAARPPLRPVAGCRDPDCDDLLCPPVPRDEAERAERPPEVLPAVRLEERPRELPLRWPDFDPVLLLERRRDPPFAPSAVSRLMILLKLLI
jgi:hypothetical protein